MVPKPGFTNQNPTIGSILGQNTSLMSDPTFFQDIGLQGIHLGCQLATILGRATHSQLAEAAVYRESWTRKMPMSTKTPTPYNGYYSEENPNTFGDWGCDFVGRLRP